MQVKFVDRILKQKLNRLKVGYNFLKTLHEAVSNELDCKQVIQLKTIDKTSTI